MARAVQRSRELARILGLPRRTWEAQAEALAGSLTAALKTPEGTMSLRPVQAAALGELFDHGGLVAQLRVGAGKTLISALAGPVLDLHPQPARRPMLVVPAALREKTISEFRDAQAHFRLKPIRIVSYSELSVVSGAQMLDSYQPDLIILDEAQKAKDPKAACTKRLHRYIVAARKEGKPLRVLAMSGTVAKRSLWDFWHIVHWCLPHLMPLPVDYHEASDWAAALDEKVAEFERVEPGALLELCSPEDIVPGDVLATARRGVRRRMFETPGMMATTDPGIACSLYVIGVELEPPPELDDCFQKLRQDWETPDGWPIAEAVALWRHARELALGFYYKWEPRPPTEWLARRKAWCQAVRDILTHNRRQLDTELQVALEIREAIKDGRHHEAKGEYQAWHDIRDTFLPNTVPVWVSEHALNWCAKWGHTHHGIIWTEHSAFATELSKRSTLDYYGPQGLCGTRPIEKANPKKSLIASIAANSTGRNLQAWNRALVTSAPPTGTLWEQMLGRIHRDGQKADEVVYEVILGCAEQIAGLEQAKKDCLYHTNLLGTPMKLGYADLVVPMIRHGSRAAFAA